MNRSYLLLCGLVAYRSRLQHCTIESGKFMQVIWYSAISGASSSFACRSHPREQIIVDTAVILADSSGSMRNPDQYPWKKR